LACETNSPGNPAELFAVASRHADCSVYQFMAQDRCDLHRQQVLGRAQVGPDKDLKIPVLTALIIPALADVSAAPAAGGESNCNAQLRRQGSPSRLRHSDASQCL
jgi:hypothetical protein